MEKNLRLERIHRHRSQIQSNLVNPSKTQSNPVKPSQIKSHQVNPSRTQSIQTRSNQINPIHRAIALDRACRFAQAEAAPGRGCGRSSRCDGTPGALSRPAWSGCGISSRSIRVVIPGKRARWRCGLTWGNWRRLGRIGATPGPTAPPDARRRCGRASVGRDIPESPCREPRSWYS